MITEFVHWQREFRFRVKNLGHLVYNSNTRKDGVRVPFRHEDREQYRQDALSQRRWQWKHREGAIR